MPASKPSQAWFTKTVMANSYELELNNTDMERLQAIKKALYSEARLSGDTMRNMAQWLEVIIDKADKVKA